jgi:hypothetical protein
MIYSHTPTGIHLPFQAPAPGWSTGACVDTPCPWLQAPAPDPADFSVTGIRSLYRLRREYEEMVRRQRATFRPPPAEQVALLA